MNDLTFSYSMGFSAGEKAELLTLLASSPKWVERVSGAFGHVFTYTGQPSLEIPAYVFTSPGIPSWAKPLPSPLHVGKRVRYQWHENGKEVYYTGTITSHYIDGDDCSGTYGEHRYGIKSDTSSPHKGGSCSCAVKYCQLIDYTVPPISVTGEPYQVDLWGKTYYLVNNGDMPSGIKYL
jgi:hypothetical protein